MARSAHFSNYIASRYQWNYALVEPEADVSRGTQTRLMYVMGTLDDIEDAVAKTALSLGDKFIEGFDSREWLLRWNAAKVAGD